MCQNQSFMGLKKKKQFGALTLIDYIPLVQIFSYVC